MPAAIRAFLSIAGLSIEDWSGEKMSDPTLAAERIFAAREAIDAVETASMLIGRNKNFRVPGTSAAASIAREAACAAAGADCLFVPILLDHGAMAGLVAAVVPKPVNVLVHDCDDTIRAYAVMAVRRYSVGGSLARRT